MNATKNVDMAKKKTPPPKPVVPEPEETANPPKARYPSRENLKYVYIPKDYWLILDELGDEQERSVSYFVKKAVEEYLAKRSLLPKKKE